MRVARAFHLTPTEREKVIFLAARGVTTSTLMRRFQVSKTAIQKILRKASKTDVAA